MNGANSGSKSGSKEEEEQKLEAEPAPCEPAIPSPERCNGSLTGRDDLNQDKLQPRADVKQDEADDQDDQRDAEEKSNDRRPDCWRNPRHVAVLPG